MGDILSKRARSRRMAAIRSKNTTPEVRLRHALFANGFRYRLHSRSLPGAPDLVFAKHCAVVNVRGCFWHQHTCRDGHIPRSRKTYWEPKLLGNTKRDLQNSRNLRRLGWRELVVWECQVRSNRKLQKIVQKLSLKLPRHR